MRDKINENPLAQVALIGVLIVVGFVMLTSMGGGGESAPEAEAEAPATAAPALPEGEAGATVAAVPAAGPPPATSPPPKAVTVAYDSGKTVVLLVVREGGIDDQAVKDEASALSGIPDVSLFVVPSQQIARYAAITEGAGVNRVPALVVMRPKALGKGTPTASVTYGYQDAEGAVQAVTDARYKGRTLSYHP
jgi:hypothetical protein